MEGVEEGGPPSSITDLIEEAKHDLQKDMREISAPKKRKKKLSRSLFSGDGEAGVPAAGDNDNEHADDENNKENETENGAEENMEEGDEEEEDDDEDDSSDDSSEDKGVHKETWLNNVLPTPLLKRRIVRVFVKETYITC